MKFLISNSIIQDRRLNEKEIPNVINKEGFVTHPPLHCHNSVFIHR